MDWCIFTQSSLLRQDWPREILQIPEAAEEFSEDGEVIWRGPRVRMAVHVGTPSFEMDRATSKMMFSGPVVKKAKQMLALKPHGSIIVSSALAQELAEQRAALREPVRMEHTNSRKPDGIIQVLPASLFSRARRNAPNLHLPHSIGDGGNLEFSELGPIGTNPGSWTELSLPDLPTPGWLVKWEDLSIRSLLGKGSISECYLGKWRHQDVIVKVLKSQSLKENDLIRLYGDSVVLSKIDHHNLLPFYALCIEPAHTCVVTQYMRRGNLNKVLSEEATLSYQKCLEIAKEIATGMAFLATHPDPLVRVHDTFKSNNVLVSGNWEVKVADHGQSSIKDLARTITSVADVSWTAPEVLNGAQVSPQSAFYSFGIIMWQLYTRKLPYEGEYPILIVTEVLEGKRPPVPPDCPVNFRMLMEACWEAEPDHRPTWPVVITELAQMIDEIKHSE